MPGQHRAEIDAEVVDAFTQRPQKARGQPAGAAPELKNRLVSQVPFSGASGKARRCAQQPVAQGFGFGFGQVAG